MGKRKQSRTFGGLAFTFLLTVLIVGMAVPVLAHWPVITAEYVCQPDGTYRVAGHAGPWDGGGLARRTNPAVEVHRGAYDGPLVATGEFVVELGDVPGFDWTDPMVFPGDVAQNVTYVVIVTENWGGKNQAPPRDPDNLHPDQTVSISLPGTCVPDEIPGSITVKKVATGDPTSTWLFDLSDSASDPVLGDGIDFFIWTDLAAGNYSLTENAVSGWRLAGVSCGDVSVSAVARGVSIDLAEGAAVTCTFTNRVEGDGDGDGDGGPSSTGAIGDFVWEDTNADGHQGEFEFGVAGVTVNLLNSSGLISSSTVTDATGHYLFSGLSAGTYEVQFILPAGYEVSPLRAAAADLDSDAGVAGRTGGITLESGQTDLTWDAGIFKAAEVLPQVITTTTTTTGAAPPETLPFTGGTTGGMGGVGLALLTLGSVVLLAIRKREGHTEDHPST